MIPKLDDTVKFITDLDFRNSVCNDREFMTNMVAYTFNAIRYAGQELLNNLEFILDCIYYKIDNLMVSNIRVIIDTHNLGIQLNTRPYINKLIFAFVNLIYDNNIRTKNKVDYLKELIVSTHESVSHLTEEMLVIYYQNILDGNTNIEQNYDLPDFD